MTLESFFTSHRDVAVAFSGGVDSAYLLWAAKQYANRVQAYFVKTVFQPDFELEDAYNLARQLDVPLCVLQQDILSVPHVAENGCDRCFFCKHALMRQILEQAQADGFSVLLDGTNASDSAEDRPGMRALQQLQVLSPLRLCNLSKAEIRRASRCAELPTWDKPAYACLATRIPTGVPITQQLLQRIAHAEGALREIGFSDFRVRILNDCARLQLPEAQFMSAMQRRDEILAALAPQFSAVLLDLQPRRTVQEEANGSKT